MKYFFAIFGQHMEQAHTLERRGDESKPEDKGIHDTVLLLSAKTQFSVIALIYHLLTP